MALDAHSELMSAYPWGWTTPNAGTFNLQDTGAYDQGALLFRETGTPPVPNASEHDWAALVAGSRTPQSHELGPEPPRPAGPGRRLPADGPAPPTCDDGAFGKGTGGQLRWQVQLVRNEPTTLWFAVAGSDQGVAARPSRATKALADPEAALAQKVASRQQDRREHPGRPARRPAAGEQHRVEQAESRRLGAGGARPAAAAGRGRPRAPAGGHAGHGALAGRGLADYPWLFGTDGEYAFASVAMGQFAEIKSHLRPFVTSARSSTATAARWSTR